MSNKAVILFFTLWLCQPLIALNIYKGCFTHAIYDDDGRPDDSYTEKIKKLQDKKEQAIKVHLLDPLDHEIKRLWDLKNYQDMKAGVGLFGSWTGAFLYPPSLIAFVPGVLLQSVKLAMDTSYFEQKLSELINSKQKLIMDLRHRGTGFPEYKYIRDRARIPETFRDRIESLLIDSYETGADHKMLIGDLLVFPSRIKCLSGNGDEDRFANGLSRAKGGLMYYPKGELFFALTDALTTIAEASFNALTNRVPSRCAIYFETDKHDRALSLFKHLAYILDRSFFVVFATKDSFSNEYLFGTNETQRGIVLKAFLARKYNASLNPLLIVIGIDEWITDDNMSILLPMLDPDSPQKLFQSNYFGLEIDLSAMSVLSCGKTPYRDLPGAIKSRLQPYKID